MRISQLLSAVVVLGTSVPFVLAQDSSSLRTLYSFKGQPDGSNPPAGVVIGEGGVLYGTTSFGGASNAGTVFQLKPPASPGGAWTETVLNRPICLDEKDNVSDLESGRLAGLKAFIWSNLCTRHIQNKLTPRGHEDWPDKRRSRL